MSRIGKKPIILPENVMANITGQKIEVKGPNGSREFITSKEVEINLNDNQIVVKPRNLSKKSRQHWGMNRTQIANLIEGVTTGFTKNLIRGLTVNLVFNECDSVNIPKVVENSKQGDGVGREVNETQLEQMGESTTESNVNTRTEPEGSTQYDTEGLEQSEIDEAIAEEKEFIATQNGNYSDSKIITETDAEREELKNLLEFD